MPDELGYNEKSARFEDFLGRVNDDLRASFGRPASCPDSYFTVQILGLPRTGTTLLHQLLARSGHVGYVSNVMAFFWQVPTVGAELQRELARSGGSMSLDSLAGRTREPLDPHEFGYFWRNALGHSQNTLERDLTPTPAAELQAVLDAVANVFGAPTVYKNFLALLHAQEMRATLQRLRFIHIQRPLADVAASLLVLRRRLGPPADGGVGLRAEDGAPQSGSVVDQVVRQVVDLHLLERSACSPESGDTVDISYPELCAAPRASVSRILASLGLDASPASLSALPVRLSTGPGVMGLPEHDRADVLRSLDFALARSS